MAQRNRRMTLSPSDKCMSSWPGPYGYDHPGPTISEADWYDRQKETMQTEAEGKRKPVPPRPFEGNHPINRFVIRAGESTCLAEREEALTVADNKPDSEPYSSDSEEQARQKEEEWEEARHLMAKEGLPEKTSEEPDEGIVVRQAPAEVVETNIPRFAPSSMIQSVRGVRRDRPKQIEAIARAIANAPERKTEDHSDTLPRPLIPMKKMFNPDCPMCKGDGKNVIGTTKTGAVMEKCTCPDNTTFLGKWRVQLLRAEGII